MYLSNKSRFGGVGGVVFFIAVVGCLVALIVMSSTIRNMFGIVEPSRSNRQASLETKTDLGKVEPVVVGVESLLGKQGVSVSDRAIEQKSSAPDKPMIDTRNQAKVYRDSAEAATKLLDIRKHFNTFEWKKVRDLSGLVLTMDTEPKNKTEAREFSRKADKLEKFMSQLNAKKDGMYRSPKTHPSLVQITTNRGKTIQYLPIDSLNSKKIVETDDPVAYIEALKNSGMNIPLMDDTGTGYTEMRPDKIISVEPVDVERNIRKLSGSFYVKLNKLKNSEDAKDAMSLYKAAAYAYQNRIDSVVVDLLQQAIDIDPTLANTIREDNAYEYYQKMIKAMEKGNKRAASGWKAQLNKLYKNTSVFAQAEAYYRGKASEALAIAKRARDDKKKARLSDLKERKEIAKKYNDKTAQKKLEEKEIEIAKEEEAVVEEIASVSGDEAKADAYYAKGHEYYSQAVTGGNTRGRDALYSKAIKEFVKARSIYFKVADERPNDEALGRKMIQNNLELHAAQKQKRPF